MYTARDAAGGEVIDEAGNVQLHHLTSTQPYVTYEKNGQVQRIDCDYVAGCDGYHRVSRPSIPGLGAARLRESLSVRLAEHYVGDAAVSGHLLRFPPARICAGVPAQSDAEPVLHPV